MGDITMPPFIGYENDLLWLLIIPAIAIVALVAIISYFIEKKKKQKNNSVIMEQKKEPFLFVNKSNNDIIIIAPDNYLEIITEFSLYDKNQKLIKIFTQKELNFITNEQRIISNIKNFDAYQIKYKIIDFK